MKKNLFATLFVGAALAVPAFSQNGANVSRYTSHGYAQTVFMNHNGINGLFMVEQNVTVDGGRQVGNRISGYASGILPNGHLVLFSTNWNDWNANVTPSNRRMTEPGYGDGWFTASRLEIAFGPFGISIVSQYDGVMNAGATLQNPAFLDTTSDKDHYTFAYPEIGFGFSYNALYRGTIGFEPVGTGYMTFTANGVTETLFPQGTPASPASWMGWFISREVEISSNN